MFDETTTLFYSRPHLLAPIRQNSTSLHCPLLVPGLLFESLPDLEDGAVAGGDWKDEIPCGSLDVVDIG